MQSRNTKALVPQLAVALMIGVALALVPEIAAADAASSGLKGQESNLVSQMVTAKNLCLGLAFLSGVGFSLAGVWSLYKSSQEGSRTEKMEGWKKIGIGAVSASLLFFMSLAAGTLSGDSNTAMQEQRAILK